MHVQLRHPHDAAGGPPPAESPATPKRGDDARGGERQVHPHGAQGHRQPESLELGHDSEEGGLLAN